MTRLEPVEFVCAVPAPARPAGSEVDVATFDELLARRAAGHDLVLIDVREPVEHAAGSIPGARMVPKDEILNGRVELPRERPLLLHCAGGGRSGVVLDHLLASGYRDVRHLVGGYDAWAR